MSDVNEVRNITDAEFEEITGNGLSLVDFWAPWCHPCRIQGPILNKVAAKMGEKAKICKMNVDEEREAAMKFGVTSIPSLMVFKDGEMVGSFVGVQQEDILVNKLNDHA